MKNFTDLFNAREHIQSNARSCADIGRWLRDNPWFVVVAQIEALSNDWNPYKQQLFLQAYGDFSFKTCKMLHEDNAIEPLHYRWGTSLDYAYLKQKVPDDMALDMKHALSLLGLTLLGDVSRNSTGKTIVGHVGLNVPASSWHFVAGPCIEDTFGSEYWDLGKSGANRWFPNADLGGLALVHDSIGSTADDIRALAKSRLLETKSRSGSLCGPPEFSL